MPTGAAAHSRGAMRSVKARTCPPFCASLVDDGQPNRRLPCTHLSDGDRIVSSQTEAQLANIRDLLRCVVSFALPRRRLRSFGLVRLRFPRLATQPDLHRHRAAAFLIIRRDDRVVRLETIVHPIFCRRHTMRRQVAAQRLILLPVDHADYVVRIGKRFPN